MYKIFKTPLAQNDLKEIWHFTCKTWGIEQADKYLRQLNTWIGQLSQNPNLGKACDNIRAGYRSIHINRHIAYYLMQGEQIEIVRVLHENMDA